MNFKLFRICRRVELLLLPSRCRGYLLAHWTYKRLFSWVTCSYLLRYRKGITYPIPKFEKNRCQFQVEALLLVLDCGQCRTCATRWQPTSRFRLRQISLAVLSFFHWQTMTGSWSHVFFDRHFSYRRCEEWRWRCGCCDVGIAMLVLRDWVPEPILNDGDF